VVKPVSVVTLSLLLLCGCGASTGAPCADGGEALRPIVAGGPLETRYQPLVVGATWVYQVNDGVETTMQTVTVEAEDTFAGAEPGARGFRVLTQKAYGVTLTSWWEDRGDQVVRHRELSVDGKGVTYGDETFIPARPVVDELAKHLTLGATWKQRFSDIIQDSGTTYSDCKSDKFAIQATEEQVTVPAGTFTALKVTRTDSGATEWFAQGVGRVKHVSNSTAELVSFSIPQP
jgi:hypothetical protein